MTVGTLHQLAIDKLNRLKDEPEDYAKQHPAPRQVLSVIEVSESSLERDRTTKHRLYAAAYARVAAKDLLP